MPRGRRSRRPAPSRVESRPGPCAPTRIVPTRGGVIAIDRPTAVADFPPRLAEAVAATLRAHGLPAEVIDRGDAADVVVSMARRDDAVALMASHMDEIRDRVDADRPDEPAPVPVAAPGDDDPAAGATGEEPGSRRMVFERLRAMWPVPVMLVPLLVLLGFASVPANFAVIAMIGGMTAVVALRQRRRAPRR